MTLAELINIESIQSKELLCDKGNNNNNNNCTYCELLKQATKLFKDLRTIFSALFIGTSLLPKSVSPSCLPQTDSKVFRADRFHGTLRHDGKESTTTSVRGKKKERIPSKGTVYGTSTKRPPTSPLPLRFLVYQRFLWATLTPSSSFLLFPPLSSRRVALFSLGDPLPFLSSLSLLPTKSRLFIPFFSVFLFFLHGARSGSVRVHNDYADEEFPFGNSTSR